MKKIFLFFAVAFCCCSVHAATYISDDFDAYESLTDVRTNWSVAADGTTSFAYSAAGGRNGTPCIVAHVAYSGGTSQYYMRRDPNPSGTFGTGYIRFYFRFENHGGSSPATKFFKLHGAVADGGYANYTFSMQLDAVVCGNGSGVANDGVCRFGWDRNNATCSYSTYSYHNGAPSYTDGEWHAFECYIYENTNGNSDGVVQVWFDGEEYLNVTGMKMRHDTNPRDIAEMGLLSYFYPSEDDDPNDDYYVYFDDIVTADSYIGLASGDPAPAPPTLSNVTISGGSFR